MSKFFRFILFSFTLLCLNTYGLRAQQTVNPYQERQLYEKAYDLYTKAKYASAIPIFEQAAKSTDIQLKADAEYYAALCALQLNHPSAEQKFVRFLAKYPQHIQKNNVHIELVKYQIAHNNHKEALKNLEKIDKSSLNEAQLNEYYFNLGYANFLDNYYETAKDSFEHLINKPNKYKIPATYYYAYIAYREGRYNEAVTYFKQVEKDDAYGKYVKYYLAQVYSQQHRYDEVLEITLPLLEKEQSEQRTELLRLTADAYFQKGQYQEALSYHEKYLAALPQNISPVDHYEIGFENYYLKNYDEAVKHLQMATEATDTVAQYAYFHLGDTYLKTKQNRFALNAFNSAYKLKSNPQVTEEALFNVAKLSAEFPDNAYNNATKALVQYIEEYPESPRIDEAYGYLADIYALTKNYKSALASFEKIKKRNSALDASYQRIAFFRALELFNEKNYDESLRLLQEAQGISSNPSLKALSSYWIGEIYYRKGEWNKALEAYKKFSTSAAARSTDVFYETYYNMGYAYFKLKDYTSATSTFLKFVASPGTDQKQLSDAFLRLGDCSFMNKKYDNAIAYYQKGVDLESKDNSYGLYQIAMCHGALGNLEKKIVFLQKIIQGKEKVSYGDDALYEMALTYSLLNRDNMALTYYQKLQKEYPTSIHLKKALLKSGLIYYNQNKDDEALEALKKAAEQYPGTSESNDALASIKNIYVEKNKVDDYVDFAKKIGKNNMADVEADSLTYIAAENIYMNNDCEKAIASFNKYLTKYPGGAFALQAAYYKADCEYRAGNVDDALKSYEIILSQPNSRYTATSAQRAAAIYQNKNNCEKALTYYTLMSDLAEENVFKVEALTGSMRCNYNMQRYGIAVQKAQQLLALGDIPSTLTQETHLIMGKSAYELKNKELAQKEFNQTIKIAQNEKAAEAKYMLSQILYDNNKFDETEKSLLALSDKYSSYDYWVAKGFILLSDVYVKKGNVFQAKETLKSIIDNYEGNDELVVTAREKLSRLSSK